MTEMDRQLNALDEALRASALANGYHFPDTEAVGLVPEDEVQPPHLIAKMDRHQAALENRFGRPFPETARFMAAATINFADNAFLVSVEPVQADEEEPVFGAWPTKRLEELIQSYREAEG